MIARPTERECSRGKAQGPKLIGGPEISILKKYIQSTIPQQFFLLMGPKFVFAPRPNILSAALMMATELQHFRRITQFLV